MKAVKIEDHSVTEIEVENTLEALQEQVNGYIEAVTLIPDKVTMLINEEGLIKNMATNLAATIVAGIDIVGPAIVVGVNGDEFTDVPAEVAQRIITRFGGKV